MWFIADRDNARVRIGYPASIVLLFAHVVDDVLLRVFLVSPRRVDRAYDVYLVVLKLRVAFIQIEYVIRVVYSEYAVRGVPVDVEGLRVVPHHALDEENEHQQGPGRLPHSEVSEGHHSVCSPFTHSHYPFADASHSSYALSFAYRSIFSHFYFQRDTSQNPASRDNTGSTHRTVESTMFALHTRFYSSINVEFHGTWPVQTVGFITKNFVIRCRNA